MDALYGDLENYNEVYIIEELRNENNDLKLKLEEYETAIGNLQKDYDKLVLEFNNLQNNYSSLLKTARAEVERKAQMITQLNLDKNMMVLKTLQNGNNIRFQNRIQNNTQKQMKATDRETDKVNIGKKTKPEHNKSNVKNEGDKTRESTNVTGPKSDNTQLLNIVDKVVEKVETSINKDEFKENVTERTKIRASSIKNRRKSMPAFNVSHLTTDEENESDKTYKSKPKNEVPPKEKCETNNINEKLPKTDNEGLSNKTSDTTSLSGRSSNYQAPVRGVYKSGRGRRFDYEKFRGDKIRESDRSTDKTGEIQKNREGDKFRERYSYRKDENIQDFGQTREGDKYRNGNQFREGDKCREIQKLKEGVKYRDSDQGREDVPFREVEKFRDIDKFRGETFNEPEKYGESENKNRHMDRYRMVDRCREIDRYRENEQCRQGDKYCMIDKYCEGDRFREEYNYWHTEKFRSRNKFDPSYRNRRHYSPDRPYKRNFRECQDKLEYGRHRVLQSPPPDSYNFSYQRSQDKQIFYEGHRLKGDKFKHRHELTHVESLSVPEEYNEPFRKRQKFEYESDENRRYHDREPVIKPSCSVEYDMLRASCQSPDAVFSPDSHPDTTVAHTVIEIKNTAATPLEDPRMSSKKYILSSENGTTNLFTTASRCIDIKPIDKSLWDIQSVAMPDALLHEPHTYFDDENIKDIYMDIDRSDCNVSVETGEIVEDTFSSSVNHEENLEKRLQVNDVNKTAANVISTKKMKAEKVKRNCTMCKIPEEIPVNQQCTDSDVPSQSNLDKKLPEIVCDDNFTNNIVKENPCSATPQSKPLLIDEYENSVSDNTNINVLKNKRAEHSQISLSEMAMIQNDLELSDETSDNLDCHKAVIENKVLRQTQSILEEKKGNDLESETKFDYKITPESNVETIKTNEKLEGDGHKKLKSKRRKTKSKEKEVCEKNIDINVKQKKIKCKKEKEIKPKQIKNKFTDLFGDSSSLITPEDLGIPSSCVPQCEDAQDAVDINIKDIAKPPTCTNKVKINEIMPKTNVDDTNARDKEIGKQIMENVTSPPVDTNIVYQNLNSETETTKPDIIKTVIISSGVQPQFLVDSKEKTMAEPDANVDVNKGNIGDFNQLPADMEFKKQILLKALATSTPHKDFPIHKTIEPDCVNVSNDLSNNESIDTMPPVSQTSVNTQESCDAPDVRIFVRRRRKGVKKT